MKFYVFSINNEHVDAPEINAIYLFRNIWSEKKCLNFRRIYLLKFKINHFDVMTSYFQQNKKFTSKMYLK